MGRYVKNEELKSGSYTVRLPHSVSSIGPDSPVNGMVKYDDTTNTMQFYKNSSWITVSKVGRVDIVKDSFTGNSSNLTYGPMSYSYAAGKEASVIIFVGNVFQNPGVAYNFDGSSSVTFTSSPPTGQSIVILHNFNSTDAA